MREASGRQKGSLLQEKNLNTARFVNPFDKSEMSGITSNTKSSSSNKMIMEVG
jgi:hypothetical protein